jgi:hypothetical protein
MDMGSKQDRALRMSHAVTVLDPTVQDVGCAGCKQPLMSLLTRSVVCMCASATAYLVM